MNKFCCQRTSFIILYDAAYRGIYHRPINYLILSARFVEQKGSDRIPQLFEEFAGFTGVRCGYTIVPKELKAKTLAGEEVALNPIWDRRQCTKFNGTSYISASVLPKPSIPTRVRNR